MWKEIWIIMLVLAFICLAVAILLTFIWDIPNLIDELSGRKAKRQIKMLHELNSSTSTFDKLSTNEIYSGISSGTLLNEELVNTCEEEEIENYNNKDVCSFSEGDEEECSTSYLSEDGDESTSYLEDDTEDSTSYLDIHEEDSLEHSKEDMGLEIKIIEEQSSL
ncbi:hypothetical protein ACEE21_15010 [Clostridium baratii]